MAAADFADVTDDTLTAIERLYATDTATLPKLLRQPPQAGRLRSQEPPYVQAAVELDGRDLVSTGGSWWDRRRVSLKAYGTKAQAVVIGAALFALFNRRTGVDASLPFVYPSGAKFYRWWPDGGVSLTEDPAVKAGQDQWVAELKATVTSIRKK